MPVKAREQPAPTTGRKKRPRNSTPPAEVFEVDALSRRRLERYRECEGASALARRPQNGRGSSATGRDVPPNATLTCFAIDRAYVEPTGAPRCRLARLVSREGTNRFSTVSNTRYSLGAPAALLGRPVSFTREMIS